MLQSLSKIAASLITNDSPDNYQEVAVSWLAALFVIVVVSTIVLILYQWTKKRMDPRRRQWGRVKILLLMLAGLGFTMIAVVLTYVFSLDFQTVVGTPGLYKGIVHKGRPNMTHGVIVGPTTWPSREFAERF